MLIEMDLERLRHCICDRFDAVRPEASCSRAADAFQVLDEQLHLVAMIAIAEEQRAYAAQCFGHREDVRSCLAYVQEHLDRLTVIVIHRNICHAEWRVELISRSTQDLRPLHVMSVAVRLC